MKTRLILVLLITTALAACGRDDAQPETTPTPDDPALHSTLFDRIDADAPYLYANLQRFPDAVADAIWRINEQWADDPTLPELLEGHDLPPLARALGEEYLALTTREGWTAAGLHDNPLFAVHGVSVFPVIHLELADRAAFEALLARVSARAEIPLPTRRVGEAELIWVDLNEAVGIAVSHDEHFATVALVPNDEAVLGRVAGTMRPDQSYSPDALNRLNRDAGYTPHGSGFIDWASLTSRLLSGEDRLLQPLAEREELSRIAGDPACRAEYMAIARALPRTLSGYTRVEERRIDLRLRQETSAAIGSGLAGIADTPVQVDRELDGVANFGFSANLLAARDFARQLVAGWIANPPACPSLSWVNDQAADWQLALNRPIPPVVTNLQGVFVELETLEIGANQIPTGGGALAIYMRNPQLLVGMAQMFSPAVAALDLRAGGEPKPLPRDLVPELEGLELDAFIAMGENALALAIGENNLDRLGPLLARATPSPAIFSARFDVALAAELLAAQARQTLAGLREKMDPYADDEAAGTLGQLEESQLQMAEQYRRMAEVYERLEFTLELRPEGIDLNAGIRLNAD